MRVGRSLWTCRRPSGCISRGSFAWSKGTRAVRRESWESIAGHCNERASSSKCGKKVHLRQNVSIESRGNASSAILPASSRQLWIRCGTVPHFDAPQCRFRNWEISSNDCKQVVYGASGGFGSSWQRVCCSTRANQGDRRCCSRFEESYLSRKYRYTQSFVALRCWLLPGCWQTTVSSPLQSICSKSTWPSDSGLGGDLMELGWRYGQ